MSRTKVARHRAARRPSTPLTVPANKVFSSENGRRASALAGSGVALTVIAAGAIPTDALQAKEAAVANSVDSAKVAQAVVEKVATNPVVDASQVKADSQTLVSVDNKATKSAEKRPQVTATPAASTRAAQPAATRDAGDVANFPWDSVQGNQVIQIARQYLGRPYVWGASGPSAFDCSGLVSYVYRQVGINLPHQSGAIASLGQKLPLSAAQPGDILWHPGHVALYAGNGYIIHANHPGGSVVVSKLYRSNWSVVRL